MGKTRLSLFYLAGYLSIGGFCLLVFPQTAVGLLLSNGDYSNVMLRMVGVFFLAIATIVVQFIRHRTAVLYPTTLIVRAGFLTAFISFYVIYKDPMMIVIAGIVGFGFILTMTAYLLERKQAVIDGV